ncbi:succinate dehydrogenase cytochrome b subunit [Sinomicrobium oceani]|uniref:succinate dehydrogenase cytochrome b subunit n=1 Tax=Sinomicrobium oceani TaxID=1150368 RepID=UPI00227C5551|nr:succinate dehydrogenase cytochrome b subunit [Sinomicrobium oceani]
MWFVKNMITRKNLMALTGLFLAFFLIIHLLGNLQLLLPDEVAREQYNWYSHLLAGNIIIEIIAIVLYACILLHLADAIYLTIRGRKVSGNYRLDKRARASTWYSRNMMFLGAVIFAFLVIHFKDFWYQYKFGTLPLDEKGHKDLYTLVVTAFGQLWYVIVYIIAIIALGYHMLHGVFSAHRTLGLYHPVYNRIVRTAGVVFSVAMTFGYAVIPIVIYIKQPL